MYRNTRMYDTLMQMGRWFGYRPDYEDLCRVHLSPDSINWYSHIAEASEELRQQIKKMRRDGLSPRQFGLYVEAHPDRLLITAANKMRDATRVVVSQSFSGKLRESHILPTDDKVNKKNEELINRYWISGFGGAVEEPTGKGWIFKEVAVEIIEEFLNSFLTHPAFAETKSGVVSYLQALSEKFTRGDVLLISKDTGNPERFHLGAQERSSTMSWSDHCWRLNKDRVASRGDERLGLTEGQKDMAALEAGKKPSDVHFRQVRNKPLLMVHILEPIGHEGKRIPAIGVSFPPGQYGTNVEVVANRVWIEKMYGPLTDDPDNDEDYDA